LRGEKTGDRDLVSRILSAAKIQDWELKDLDIFGAEALEECSIGVALGQTCGRLVEKKVKKLFILPPIDKLKLDPSNEKDRQKAWKQVQEIAKYLENYKPEEEKSDTNFVDKSWEYVIMRISNKQLCIYEGVRPSGLNVDAYMSRDDLKLLLNIKEALKADEVTFEIKE